MVQNSSVYDGNSQILDLFQDETGLARHILTNGLYSKDNLETLEQLLSFDHLALQVARDLDYQGLLTRGSSLSFDDYLTHTSPQSNVDALIKQSQTLFKIIGNHNWSDFVKQITDYSYRPKLRTTAQAVKTHKFVHHTQGIIPYNPVKKVKVPHQHTKKQSATLLSPFLNTEYFGQKHANPAVGFLFNRNQCVIKGMFKYDRGTFHRQWVGTEEQVKAYYTSMHAEGNLFVNEASFVEHVRSTSQLNEVLAKLSKEAIIGIWVASNTMDAKKIAIERQQELFKLFDVKHPIYLYDNQQKKVVLYTEFMQYQDICNLSLNEFSLYNAVSQGDFANLVNPTKEFITKLLQLAIKDNNTKLIEALLIRLGPKYINFLTNIVLAWAAQNGHVKMIVLLLAKDADVNTKDKDGKTALISAARNGQIDVLELLLNSGANIESHDINQSTALHWAAQNGHIKVVEYLLEKGALLEAKGANCSTALIFAAERGHMDVVKGLLEKGANIEAHNINQITALHYAAYNGHVDVLELLLNSGANIEAHDINQNTALHYAAYNGHVDVLELLLQKNARVDARNSTSQNVLDMAIAKHPKLINPILMHLASLPIAEQAACLSKVVGGPYQNVLFYAEAKNDAALFDALMDKILVNPCAQHIIENQAYTLAAKTGARQSMGKILALAFNIEPHTWALGWAVSKGHIDVVNDILERDKTKTLLDNPEAGKNSYTALHLAVSWNRPDIVAQLLKKGANVNIRNNDGNNALDSAIARYPKLIKPILMHIATLPMDEQVACLAKVAGGPYENVLTYAAIEMPSLFHDLLGPVRNIVNLDHGHYDEHFKNIRDHYMNMREKSLNNSSYIDASVAAGELLRTCVQAKIDLIQCENMSAETITKFKSTCISAIEKARPILLKHRQWGTMLAAFLLAIITLPVSIPLFAMGFFSIKTKSEQLIDRLQEASIQSMPG